MTTLDLTHIRVTPTLHWLEAFGLWLRQTPTQKRKTRSPKTLDAYLQDVRHYSRYFEEINHCPFSPDQLNRTDLQSFFAGLEKDAKPATYNRKHASLSLLVKFAQENDLLEYDPLAWIPRLEAVRKAPRDLDQREQDALIRSLAALPDDELGLRDKLLVELMLAAGLRIHEAVGLKGSDLHLDENYIHILGKGGKHRDVTIGSRLIGLLRIWLDHKPASAKEALFQLTTGQARRRFYEIRASAGLDKTVTPHALRHTYINNLLAAYMAGDPLRLGTAIKAVCQLTGDDPKVILEYYTNPRQSDIRAAVEAL